VRIETPNAKKTDEPQRHLYRPKLGKQMIQAFAVDIWAQTEMIIYALKVEHRESLSTRSLGQGRMYSMGVVE